MVDKRRIAHAIGLLALVVVVVPFVVYAFPSAVGADHSFVVLSGSMEPDIAPGDVVIVDEGSTEAIEEGDIITFVRSEGDKPVTHRVVGVEERGDTTVFTTKGDANEDVDSQPVPAGNVIGEVSVTIPYIGHVIQFAQRPVGFVALVLLPLGLLGLSEVWTIVRKQRGDGGADGAGDGTVATAATATSDPTVADTSTDDDGEITLTATDLTLATGILLLVAPYTVWVALQLRNPVTFTAAFAAIFSFVGVAGLWLTARGGDADQSSGAPDDDDGWEDGDVLEDSADAFDDDWALDESDGTFTFDDTGGDGFAEEFDGAFGDGTEATADAVGAPTDGSGPTAGVTADDAGEGDAPGDDGFFDDPTPESGSTGADVFDDTAGSTEEVD
ncbi:signal peptidase I [Haloarchaeobius iranensis]|uniref:Signal peptidase, endoplasmic reticulum-type n=1 Tax=Haloarchaeobius iranensis TaxID=996166 RepID=A0A1G9YG24_9EURY|nr:signal peptidase I [Haloarchaeobius iranensis]SDN08129.1 signal peptidase, endoplasmic reticulum-type [Haloarchaeobius iranensis]